MNVQVKIINFGFACKIDKNVLTFKEIDNTINMDPIILKKLNASTKKARQLGYDQKADVWSIGTICYEMLIGKSAFDSEDMEELVEKIEEGEYKIPTNLSKEIISFINGMLQYESQKRLTCEELAKHPFLTNSIEHFHPIDKLKCADKLDHSQIKMNSKMNKSIWAIFNSEDEIKLMSIDGKDYSQNQEHNDGLKLPSNGIPGNPIDQKIQYEDTGSSTLSFGGGIFDN
jgi:serine/threonine protein kinase